MVNEFGAELSVIGKPGNIEYWIEHKVTGKLDFGADHPKVDMLYARILTAPHAHALITSIDTSQAEALEGVEAVITYEEHPSWSDGVFYWGTPIAAVAAVDEATASRALELIDVVYDVRPAVIDPEEAMKDEVLVGVRPESNVQVAAETERGDIAAGFAEADVIIDETVGWSAWYQHNQIEPDSGIAWWVGDDVYAWGTGQNPYSDRNGLAASLGIPQNKTHFYTHGSGGGYGGKGSSNYHVTAALLSKKTGKPVQCHLSRFEHLLHLTHQHPFKATVRMGCKSNGTLTAIDCTIWGDEGSNPRGTASGGTGPIRTTFKCPNGHFTVIRVNTNKPIQRHWRCVADPPGQFVTDQVIEKMALELGMDPFEFRKMNLTTDDMADQDSGKPLSSNSMTEVLQKAADMAGWSQNYHAPGTKTLADGRLHGIAISGHVDGHGGISGRRGGAIQANRDGTFYLNDGIANNHPTYGAHAHIIAETIGVNYEDIMIGALGDIDACSDGGMQAGSTCTISQGAALMVAAIDVREQLFETARGLLEVEPDEPLDAAEGKIWVVADPSKSITVAEVAGKTSQPVLGRGVRWDKELRRPVYGWPVGTACEIRTMCASAAEVAVDPETGEVEILKYVNVEDCGRIVYRNAAFGQLHGGSEVSVGQALFYEQIHDKLTGASLNSSFLDHKFPTSLDIHPDRHVGALVESIDACGPYGCKGMGEPVVSNYVCILLAVNNAIGDKGEWISEGPVYPQRILKALGKA